MVRMLCSVLLLSACAEGGSRSSDASGPAGAGEVMVEAEHGVVFGTGELVKGAKFNQVDLWVSRNGEHVQLKTGGATSAKGEPVNWFVTGGVPQTFAGLSDVPTEPPSADDKGLPLQHAKPGNGFVLKNYVTGGYTRGWLKEASASSVVIEYEVLP